MSPNNNEGVLLINLGSPKELTKKSVRHYLKVFLSEVLASLLSLIGDFLVESTFIVKYHSYSPKIQKKNSINFIPN